MLTGADLRILAALRVPLSIIELSDSTEYSLGYVSERVSRLEKFDLVAVTRRNRAKEVRALRTPVLETYWSLTAAHPHIDFTSLISPLMLQVCWSLDRPTQ